MIIRSWRKAARVAMDCRMPVVPLTPRSSSIAQRRATNSTSPVDWCVFSWSTMRFTCRLDPYAWFAQYEPQNRLQCEWASPSG